MREITGFLSMFGAFAMFMYGSSLMSESIQRVARKSISLFFERVGNSRSRAIFTGFFTTLFLQSSRELIIMVISFVNSGLLQVGQALGVILGANVGATLASWIIALLGFHSGLASLTLILMGIGFYFIFFSKKKRTNTIGQSIFGIGMLLFGIHLVLSYLNDRPDLLQWISSHSGGSWLSILYFMVFGFVSTVILRSSSTNMVIAMLLVSSKILPLPLGMAMVLGGNLGITMKTLQSALKMGSAVARQVAYWDILFNLLGIVFWLGFFPQISQLLIGTTQDFLSPILILALYDTLFNLSTGLLLFPLLPLYEKYLCPFFLNRDAGVLGRQRYRLRYDKSVAADVPELSLAMARKEIIHMTEIVEEMAKEYDRVFNHPEKKMKKTVYAIREKEEITDEMYIEITKFLIECSRHSSVKDDHINVNFLSRIVKELESVADSILRLTILCQRRYKDQIDYRPEVQKDLNDYFSLAVHFFIAVKNKLESSFQPSDYDQMAYLEDCMNRERSRLRKDAQKTLESGDVNVRAEIMFMDHVRHIENLGDCCMNIAEAIRNLK